ncbi:hypothetical protein ACF06Q_08565 [Streptomyces leeuwenhoekii]|uniref:hypothetical protein n=1 Tax=Streptomyces leeuwenhoekii TaxID=1437453 RepID=UPI0036FA212C
MSDFPSAGELDHLATAARDPRARLILALAALGADRVQVREAVVTGRGNVALPDSERAAAALAEIRSLIGVDNAQAVRRAGIRARATHLTDQLTEDGVLPAVRWHRLNNQPPGGAAGRNR